jgi:hypothetical protein
MPRSGVLDEPTRRALLRDVQQLLPPHERAFAVVYDEAKRMVFASATDGNVYCRPYPGDSDSWRILGAVDPSEACVPYHVRQAQRRREAASGGADTDKACSDIGGDGSAGANSASAAASAAADTWEEAEARFAEYYIAHAHERPWPICCTTWTSERCESLAVVMVTCRTCYPARYLALCMEHARDFFCIHPTAQVRTEYPA